MSLPPPDQILIQILMSKSLARVLGEVVHLNIAEYLAEGPLDIATLAERSQTHKDSLYRALRALAAVGIFQEGPGRIFANNASSELFRREVEGSLHGIAGWMNDPRFYAAWGELGHTLRTGEPAFEKCWGEGVFDYLDKDPQAASIFQSAMSGFSKRTARAAAKAYDFSGFGRIMDIGGGHGTLLMEIMAVTPTFEGIVFDLPQVAEGARAAVAQKGLPLKVIAGDFFASVPGGADAYILKNIIHDWNDQKSHQLLSNCRRAMGEESKILVIDYVIGDGPESLPGKILDLDMMIGGGKERTEEEFRQLFERAGLRMTRIFPTEAAVSVIEGCLI